MPRLFIFDMGGVVVRNCDAWEAVITALGIPYPAEDATRLRALIAAAGRGNITSAEALELMTKRAGLPPPAENPWETAFHPRVDEKTVSLITQLKAHRQRVVCGTNTIDVHYDYHVRHGEYAAFDAVYASHLIGQIKPDKTFWYCIRDAEKDYAFSDMFFFDDLQENVCAAAALGIHAHVFTTAEDAAAYITAATGLRFAF